MHRCWVWLLGSRSLCWRRNAPGCPTCGRAPGANKDGGGRLWEGRVRESHAKSRNPEKGFRDLLAGMNPLESRLSPALRSSNWVGSSDWKGSPVSYTQATGRRGGGGLEGAVIYGDDKSLRIKKEMLFTAVSVQHIGLAAPQLAWTELWQSLIST